MNFINRIARPELNYSTIDVTNVPIKYYITHYTKLEDRKEHIINQLKKHNITDYEFITTHDPEDITEGELTKLINMKKSEKSLFLKHIDIMKKNVDYNGIIIVLEDDFIFVDNYQEELHKYFKGMPLDWDMIFSSECCDIHADNIIPNHYFYPFPRSRSTAMYIMNKISCKKLIEIFNNSPIIDRPIDIWFNIIQPVYNLKYFLTEPTLGLQGTSPESGLFKTSLTIL